MSTEDKLRELLLPVLGFDTVSEIPAESALVKDLGADSIDFVEIMYVIESNFGVVLKTNQLIAGGQNISPEDIFDEGILTEAGLVTIEKSFPGSEGRYRAGMTKADVFSAITVRDLANIVDAKIQEGA